VKKNVILVGDGGHAKIVCEILELMDQYQIIGVTSIRPESASFLGYPIIGDDEKLKEFMGKDVDLAIGIGGFRDNIFRKHIYLNLKSMGFKIASAIHPSAIVSRSAYIGEACIVFAGVVINPYVRVGNNTIIATGSTVDHESIIGNHVLVSAGVTIGGYTLIEDEALCALGAKIVSGVKIGPRALVAAGAVVVSDISEGQTVYGIPAQPKMRKV
jgi:UDP-perosamine 4-acetyltransferase